MPAKGARTTVWASWRAASSRAATASLYLGWFSIDASGSPFRLAAMPCELLLQRGKLLLRTLQGVAGGIVGCLWSKIVGEQLLLALEVDHVEVDIFLRLFDLGLHVAVTGLQRNEIIAGISDLSLGAIQRQLKLQRVQLEQDVALGDLLIVVNQDLRDDAGDVGRQPDHVGLDIRIIRRHHGAAGHIKVAAHDKRHRQQRKHQRAPH